MRRGMCTEGRLGRGSSSSICRDDARAKTSGRVLRLPQGPQAPEFEAELTARPGVGGGVGDLRGGEVARGPVGGLRAFGDAEPQHDPCEIAEARLTQSRSSRSEAEVEHALLLEGKEPFQRAQVVLQRDARLDAAWV